MNKITVLSFLLSAAIVGGTLWVADRSMTKPAGVTAISGALPPAQTTSAATPESPRAILVPTRDESAQDLHARASAVSKCVIHGKTIYSDSNCPIGSKAENITLHETGGIVSPPKESLEDLVAKRHAREHNEDAIAQQVAAVNERQITKSDQCQWLSKRIETLDAMARQPQTGQTQDWIKDQRRGVRDRQYALGC